MPLRGIPNFFQPLESRRQASRVSHTKPRRHEGRSLAEALKAPIEYNTSLQEDFRKADILQSGDFDLNAHDELRVRLHCRLRQEGDDKFSAILSAQLLMAQVSVVNIMGFSNPSDYDKFPKTQRVLSAAPKI